MARLETENLPCGGSIPPLGTKFIIEVNYMKWISIYDKLPEKSGRYLVTFTWAGVRLVEIMNFHINGHDFMWSCDNFKHRDMTNNVIAWAEMIPYLNN